MTGPETRSADAFSVSPIRLTDPPDGSAPLLVCSPHSGCHYPAEFVAQSALSTRDLRLSEDCMVDDLIAECPEAGATTLAAVYPRAYVDLNRRPWELDPRMFSGPLPDYVESASVRARAGLGTVARLVASGKDIYREALDFDAVRRRIEAIHDPYHAALSKTADNLRRRFGFCLIVDAHSMPSAGLPSRRREMETGHVMQTPDVVLGDRHGRSCDPLMADLVQQYLEGQGLFVVRNAPYAGAYTLEAYGQPQAGWHAVQIEIRRDLYMHEARLTPAEGFDRVRGVFSGLARYLAAWAQDPQTGDHLAPRLCAE